MKVRYEGVHTTKRITGINKYIGPSLSRAQPPPRVRTAFENARNGRTDGNDPSAGSPNVVHRLHRLRGYVVKFFVHDVIFDRFRLNGSERPKTDVKRYPRYIYISRSHRI